MTCAIKGSWPDTQTSWLNRSNDRLAPLSEGRMDNDVLECRYHGWQFNAKGDCKFSPQSTKVPRACLDMFPAQVRSTAVILLSICHFLLIEAQIDTVDALLHCGADLDLISALKACAPHPTANIDILQLSVIALPHVVSPNIDKVRGLQSLWTKSDWLVSLLMFFSQCCSAYSYSSIWQTYIWQLTNVRGRRTHQSLWSQEEHGMLWVWPQAGADAFLKSLNKPLPVQDKYKAPLFPVLSPDYFFFKSSADWGIMVDNAMDPSHAPALHEGNVGGRKEMVRHCPRHLLSCLDSGPLPQFCFNSLMINYILDKLTVVLSASRGGRDAFAWIKERVLVCIIAQSRCVFLLLVGMR